MMNRSAMLVIAAAIMILLLIPKINDRSTELDGKGTWRMQYVSKEFYHKEIEHKGMMWLLLLHNDSSEHEIQYYRDVLEQVTIKLDGALHVGAIDCNKYLMVEPCPYKYLTRIRLPAISVYSYAYSHGERGHNSMPIFWRVLSGLYHKHFLVYHVQVLVSSNLFSSEHPFLRKQPLPLVD